MSLRAEELTQLRADVIALLSETCEVYRLTTTPNGQGGETKTIPETATHTYACKRLLEDSKEQMQGGGTPLIYKIKLVVPWNADILHTDLLKVGTDNYEYEVTGIIDQEPHITKTIKCTRIP